MQARYAVKQKNPKQYSKDFSNSKIWKFDILF